MSKNIVKVGSLAYLNARENKKSTEERRSESKNSNITFITVPDGHGYFYNRPISLSNLPYDEIDRYLEKFKFDYEWTQSADFGDTSLPYVENPEAKSLNGEIYYASGTQATQGNAVVAAAAVIGMVAAAVSAAAEVTQATSAAKAVASTGK